MVHLLLGASLFLFVLFLAGVAGALSMHTAFILLVVSWFLGDAWCGAFYMTSQRREHKHHLV